MVMPFQVIGIWLRGLFSLMLIIAGIVFLSLWYRNRETVVESVEVPVVKNETADPNPSVTEVHERTVSWQFGFNRATAYLVGGIALLGWSIGGGWTLSPRLFRKRGKDEPTNNAIGLNQFLTLPDGSRVNVNVAGPHDGEPLIMTHGWGLDANEWYYARKMLSGKYRVISWDLPGLGKSDRPVDRDWSLDKLAQTLDSVVRLAGGKPVVLVGHSIGVMITLTYCKIFPDSLGTKVRGLVLVQGTYTNPVKTTSNAGLYTALQKPILEPLCHLMVWLSPLVAALNWLGFLNGSAHRSTEKDSFSGNETRGQLDALTWAYCTAPPDVVGRGMLAMMRYDATDVLSRIPIPTLILAGDNDRTCLPEAGRYMADRIPQAQLVELAQSKHCGFYENYFRFHEAITNFLLSLDAVKQKSQSLVTS
jgi:pimeloyl-ACP methyl ester carboxylesterase